MHSIQAIRAMPTDAALDQLVEDILAAKRPLLGRNAKIIKNAKHGYLTQVLSMAPSTMAFRWTAVNLCEDASVGCAGACLQFAGMNVQPYQGLLRIAKAIVYVKHPEAFHNLMRAEVRKLIKSAKRKGVPPALRPNGLTDQPGMALWLATEFEEDGLEVYDYTKRLVSVAMVAPDAVPPNLTWTLSRSETNQEKCFDLTRSMNLNVAVVFDVKKTAELPAKMTVLDGFNVPWTYPVVDGDVSDARFLERYDRPHVIGLRLKGTNKAKAHARKTGFAVAP